MAIKLPKYQRQVRPTAEAGAVRGDVGSAGAEWGAISQFAQTAGAVVGGLVDIKKKQDEKRDSLSLMQANDMLSTRLAEGKKQLSLMNNEEEINKFKESWISQTRSEMAQFSGGKELMSRINIGLEDTINKFGAEAEYEGSRALVDETNRALIKVQQDAIDGIGIDGMTPEESYIWASEQRAENTPKYYEQSRKDIRSFGQQLEFRKIHALADNDPDAAEKMLKDSDQSAESRVLLMESIQDSKDAREKETISLQQKNSNETNALYKQRALTRTEVDNRMMETQVIRGKEVPLLAKSEGKALIAAMDALEIDEIDMIPDLFDNVADGWKDMFKAASKDKFNSKAFDKVMESIAAGKKGSRKPYLSKSTIESQLNFAQENLYKVAEGMQLNNTTTDGLIDIVDTISTIHSEAPGNTKQDIGAMNVLIKSYMEAVKENGGQMNREQIDEWRKSNMSKELRETALINARNTYRVGEITPHHGELKYDIEFSGMADQYRYIGGGKFERVD